MAGARADHCEPGWRPAPEVDHAGGADLLDHRHVGIQVTAVRVERVVHLGQAGAGEQGVDHTPRLPHSPATRRHTAKGELPPISDGYGGPAPVTEMPPT